MTWPGDTGPPRAERPGDVVHRGVSSARRILASAAMVAFVLAACSTTARSPKPTTAATATAGTGSPPASVPVTHGSSSPAGPATSAPPTSPSGPDPFQTPSDESLIADSAAVTFASADGTR